MAIKSIYEFNVNKKVKKTVTEETPAGTLTKTVEVEEPVKVILKAPSRAEQEESGMVYSLEFSKGVKAGLLTNAIIERVYDKEGYIKDQQEQIFKKATELDKLGLEYQELNILAEKNDADLQRLRSIEDEWKYLQAEIEQIRGDLNNLYNNTAETKAEQRAIVWNTLFLTYAEDKEGNAKPVFKGDTYEAKLKHFDALAELNDEYYNTLVNKASLYIALWYMGKVQTKEEFQVIEDGFQKEIEQAKKDAEAEVKAQEEAEALAKAEQEKKEAATGVIGAVPFAVVEVTAPAEVEVPTPAVVEQVADVVVS